MTLSSDAEIDDLVEKLKAARDAIPTMIVLLRLAQAERRRSARAAVELAKRL